MRIAIFPDNFYPELSGIAESVITIAKELAARGHQVHFFAPRYSEKNFAKLGLPFKEIDLGPNVKITRMGSISFNTGTNQGRAVIPLGRAFFRNYPKADVVHAHLPFGVGLEGLLASRLWRAPLIGTNHTAIEFTRRNLPKSLRWVAGVQLAYTDWFYNRCDFVSSPSGGMFKEMNLEPGLPHKVISNPLLTDFYVPLADKGKLKEKYGFKEFNLVFVGRLSKDKSVDQLIRAAAELKGKIPSFSLGIAGSGPEEKNLRALAQKLGVEEEVKFLGFRNKDELLQIYNASDVMAIASTIETQSLSAMEAMLCGLPVVAVHSFGLNEYLKPEAGFLVRPDDPGALAEKVLYLYANPGERLQMGKVARKLVEHFNKGEIASEWEKVYEDAIKNRQK